MTETEEGKPDFFAQIKWPKTPRLRNLEDWERNKNVVKVLCEAADSVSWIESDYGYAHMPDVYLISDVAVEFLPHWGYVSVGGVQFSSSTPTEQLLEAVKHVSELKKMGARIPDSDEPIRISRGG
jgi:hypothetical protein